MSLHGSMWRFLHIFILGSNFPGISSVPVNTRKRCFSGKTNLHWSLVSAVIQLIHSFCRLGPEITINFINLILFFFSVIFCYLLKCSYQKQKFPCLSNVKYLVFFSEYLMFLFEKAFAYYARERRKTAVSKGFKIQYKSKPFCLNHTLPCCHRFKSHTPCYFKAHFVTEKYAGMLVKPCILQSFQYHPQRIIV